MPLAASLIWVSFVGAHGFSAKPTHAPMLPEFRYYYLEDKRQNFLLLADGKSTGIVFPQEVSFYTTGLDRNWHAIGGLKGSFSGALTVNVSLPVSWTGKGYRVALPLPKFHNATYDAQEASGRLIGIAYNNIPPNMDDPYDASHGFLVEGERIHDLGPADEVSFGKDGSVEGSFVGDRQGRHWNIAIIGSSLRYRFTWRSGTRKVLPNPATIEMNDRTSPSP